MKVTAKSIPTMFIACAAALSCAHADPTARVLAQAHSAAAKYQALVMAQEARAAAAKDRQWRALMAPWRLAILQAQERQAAGEPVAVLLPQDGTAASGLYQPANWAMGARPAPGAAPAPSAGGGSAAAASSSGSASGGQAPSIAGSYMGGQFTAPSGAYQLPSTPSVSQPSSSYTAPVMPQSR